MNNTLSIEEMLAQKAENYDDPNFRKTLKNLQANILKHHAKRKALYAFITFEEESEFIKSGIKEWLKDVSKKLKPAYDQIEEKNIYKSMRDSLEKLVSQYKSLKKAPQYLQPLIGQKSNLLKLKDNITEIDRLLENRKPGNTQKIITILKSMEPTVKKLKKISKKFHDRTSIKEIERRVELLKSENDQYELWIKKYHELSENDYPLNTDGAIAMSKIKEHIKKFNTCYNTLRIQELKAHFKELRKKRIFFEELLKSIKKKNVDLDTMEKILMDNREEFGNDPVKDSLILLEKIEQVLKEYDLKKLDDENDLKQQLQQIEEEFNKSVSIGLYLSYAAYKYFGKKGNQIPGGDSLSFEQGITSTDFYKKRQTDAIEKVFKDHYKNEKKSNKEERLIHALLSINWNDNLTKKDKEEEVKIWLTNSGKKLYESIKFQYGILGRDENEENKGREWFGFKDGISNPEMVLKNRTEKFDNFKSDERRKDKETEVPQV